MLQDGPMTDSTQPLRVTYDDEADAAYIYFIPDIEAGGVSRTVPVDGGERPVDSEPRRRRRRSHHRSGGARRDQKTARRAPGQPCLTRQVRIAELLPVGASASHQRLASASSNRTEDTISTVMGPVRKVLSQALSVACRV